MGLKRGRLIGASAVPVIGSQNVSGCVQIQDHTLIKAPSKGARVPVPRH